MDEDLPREIAEILRAGGHDAQTVLEQGWGGLRDADVWRRISSEGRWLMTADKGFADARTIATTEQVGVVLASDAARKPCRLHFTRGITR